MRHRGPGNKSAAAKAKAARDLMHPLSGQLLPKTVWVAIEEIESGSFADGTTYCPYGVYATKEAADAAVAGYDEEHGSTNEDGWNDEGTCLAVHEMTIER